MREHLDPKMLAALEAEARALESEVRDVDGREGEYAVGLVRRANEVLRNADPYLQVKTRPTGFREEPDTVDGDLIVRADAIIKRVRDVLAQAYPVEVRYRKAKRYENPDAQR